MRNIVAISIVLIFVIFIFVLIPPAKSTLLPENQVLESGRVLGASEALLENGSRVYSFEDLGFPGQPEPALTVEEKILRPVKRAGAGPLVGLGCAAVAIDKESSEILFSENSDQRLPIASLTKLMTALVAFENIDDLEATYEIKTGDIVGGGRQYLRVGDEVKLSNLFRLSLVASANSAAKALASATGLSQEEFVEKMNERALSLGLRSTKFASPVGLDWHDQSNAIEVARLMNEVLKNNFLRGIASQTECSFQTALGRQVSAKSTNRLLAKYPKDKIALSGGKTGFTEAAGYCFASEFSADGHAILVAVLGADTEQQRFSFSEKIADWVFDNYAWQ